MTAADEQWRRDVSRQLQETAVILERLKGELDVLDNRTTRLEASPANNRANINMIVGVGGLLLAAAVCVVGPIISALISLAIQQLAR